MRWISIERSLRVSKLPQVVRSDGTGLAASQLPLTCALKSSQAATAGSRSEAWNRTTWVRTSDRSSAGAAGAGVAAGAAAWSLEDSPGVASGWQAVRKSAEASARTSGLRKLEDIGTPGRQL